MKLKEVIAALEQFAPLPLQDDFDNAGLQVGLTEADVTGALLCLDVTEAVVREAIQLGLNLIVAHHPLLFHPLRHVTGSTYVERCTMLALQNGVAIYAAHTNLDNAFGGVNFEIARRLGLEDIKMLVPRSIDGIEGGSGVIGKLSVPVSEKDFLRTLKQEFGVECLMHNALTGRRIQNVALCGGAGSFLLREAIAQDADCFITGEMHYHDFFGLENGPLVACLGHYQSEQYTTTIIERLLRNEFPDLRIEITSLNTNPIQYY